MTQVFSWDLFFKKIFLTLILSLGYVVLLLHRMCCAVCVRMWAMGLARC